MSTRDAANDADRLCRHNAVVYLKALLAGQEVELGNRTYRLFRAGQTMATTFGTMEATCVNIMAKAFTCKDGVEREVWLGTDIHLAHFVTMAEDMSFNEAFITSAQTALSEDARRRGELRLAARHPRA